MSRPSWRFFGSLGLLAYGVLCLARFPNERERAMAVPRMTCEQMLQKGPGAGEYVTLTDVRLCRRGFAFWRDAMSPGDVDVFIPVYAAAFQQEPTPPDLVLLLEVQDSSDWQRIRDAEVVELTCQVHAGIGRVANWAQKDLAAKYQGLRLANLSVLTVGLQEPTMAKARSLLTHGIVASLVGVAVLIWLVWRRKASVVGSEQG